jgi:hypothetical protein
MIVKCKRQHCGGNIEFVAADFEFKSETSHRRLGQTIDCPHCHTATQLYMNKAEFVALKNSSAKTATPASPLIPCNVCGNQISRSAWFCFQCGEFHQSLFRIVLIIICYIGCAGALLAVIGWLIGKLFKAIT